MVAAAAAAAAAPGVEGAAERRQLEVQVARAAGEEDGADVLSFPSPGEGERVSGCFFAF